MKRQIKKRQIKFVPIILLSLIVSFGLLDAIAITGKDVSAEKASVSADESVSTYSDLSAAISRAPTDGTLYTIAVSDDIPFTGTLTIASGKNVIIESDANGRWKLIKSSTGRHFTVNGTLTLINIVMDGNWDGITSGMRGGVQVNGTGAFYLNDGAIIENCRGTGSAGTGTTNPTASGGGIGALDGSTVGVNGGIIRNNTVTGTNGGGGVYVVGTDSVFTMENGIISGNKSTTSNGPGGGISAATSCTVTIKNSTITNNEAVLINGGGVSVGNGVKFTMTGGTISLNKSSAGNGGGVYASSNATLNMTDVTVSGNTATGYGGGIGCNTSSGVAAIQIGNGRINDNIANNGGGIHLNLAAGGSVSIEGSEINANKANANGGGIYHNSSSSIRNAVTVTNSNVNNNTATTNGGGIYANSYGTVEVNGSTISGNTSTAGINTSYGGGGVYGNTYSEIIMNNSIVSGNNTTSCGGGVFGHSGSKIAVNGGTISGNSATRYGGGIYGNNSVTGVDTTITVNDAVIGGDDPNDGNTGNMGGGIGLYGASTYIINGNISKSTIKNNTAASNGGGVYFTGATSSTLDMSGCEVRDNKSINGSGIYCTSGTLKIKEGTLFDGNEASNHGGGIYITDRGTLDLMEASIVTNNGAMNGGGIYTENNQAYAGYNNVTTSSDTRFNGNHAATAYRPPENAAELYPNIGFASVSIANHPLNNYDINFIGENLPSYHIIYDANGGTGSYTGPEIRFGGTDTVLSADDTGISRTNFDFTGWNTVADGSGTAYSPGDLIVLNNNITLYAQWIPTEPQPTEPQPTEPQPTEPQPTEPQPTEPQPTEPQPTEPQPTEPPTESGQETLPPTEPPSESGQETLPPTEPPTESGQELPELGSK